jgi:3-phenylpropionate/trans-cinnamate dioxygenase ferredoxin reductase subunit
MTPFKYLIIGGGVAGTTAAETLRQNDPSGSIAIVSDEPHVFYSRIMLSKPNFFLEKIPFEQIYLKNESWYREKNITFLGGKTATGINTAEKTITLNDGVVLQYEKLLLATGGEARRWDPVQVKGADKKGIYYLRDLDEGKEIIGAIKTAKRAVCIGGGFVSFETCELLRMKGIETTLLIMEPYYWANLWDETSGLIVEDYLRQGGVEVIKNELTEEVLGAEKVEGLRTKTGKEIPCDMIIVGIGIVCLLESFKTCGLECGRGIKTNEYLETNLPDVWAAGDAAEFYDVVVGEPAQAGNWVNAQMQGRVAALNMLGKKQQFRMVSFYATQGFGLMIAFVGDVRLLPNRTIITRGSGKLKSYGRLLLKDKELVGATLLNRTPEMAPISKLIEKDVDVSAHHAELADPNFDLKTLAPS